MLSSGSQGRLPTALTEWSRKRTQSRNTLATQSLGLRNLQVKITIPPSEISYFPMNMFSVEISTTSSFCCSIFRPFNFHMAKGQNFSLQVHHVKPLGTEWRRSVGSFFVCPFWTPAQRPVMKINWFSIRKFLKKEITQDFFFEKLSDSFLPLHPSPSLSPTGHSPQNFGDSKGPHGLEAWHQHSQDGTAATQVNHLWPNPCIKAAWVNAGLWGELPSSVVKYKFGSVCYIYRTYHLNIWHVIVCQEISDKFHSWFLYEVCPFLVDSLLSNVRNLGTWEKASELSEGDTIDTIDTLIVLKLPSFSLRCNETWVTRSISGTYLVSLDETSS